MIMAETKALSWDNIGERIYETGTSKGVLYPQVDGKYPKGIVWSGLTGVTESPSGAEPTALYADNIKYLNLYSVEEFGATIEAYTYPPEFAECDGSAKLTTGVTVSQQPRKAFGLSYQTIIGNDTEGENHGYKIHLVYGCMVSPSEKAYTTINDNPDAVTFSWEVSSTPVNVSGFKPTSILTVDSTAFSDEDGKAKLKKLEDALYGTTDTEAHLPLPDEVLSILTAAA